MWEDERETKRTAGDVALTEPPAAARLVVMLAAPDELPLLVALPESEPELGLALPLALEIADVEVAAWEEGGGVKGDISQDDLFFVARVDVLDV